MIHIANTLIYMTRFDEGLKAIQEARELAEKLGSLKWLFELKGLATPLYYLRAGELDTASREAEEGAALATRIGAAEQETYGTFRDIRLGQ